MTGARPWPGDGRPVLVVDASTYVGTAAVLRDGVVASERDTAMRSADAERLMPAVIAALGDAGIAAGAVPALGAVVCGGGPGSFTSLRIAASIAKGMAVAAEAPLFAAPSLALMAAGAAGRLPAGRYLATLDAMRGERYAALVTLDADVAAYEYLGIVPAGHTRVLAREHDASLLVAGSGEPEPAAIVAPPHARGAARLGALLAGLGPVPLDAWEPDYGRQAEAQVKWEAAHGRALPAVVEDA